jgi:hypothetical protein
MVKQEGRKMTSSTVGGYKLSVLLQPGRHPAGEMPHEALANLRNEPEAVAAFEKRWNLIVRPKYSDRHSPDLARQRFAYRDTLRAAWRGDGKALTMVQADAYKAFAKLGLMRISHKQIGIGFRDMWAVAYLLFLQDHAAGKTGVCGNPGCLSPYFIKKRTTQKFCDQGPCVMYAQRQYALKWWNEEGKKLRTERSRKARSKRGKQ